MLDSVTVVLREELPVLQLQAQSLALYCGNLGTVYVVVNDHDLVAAEIDPAWWGHLANQVRVLPRSYFGVTCHGNGWVSQQVLKMLAAGVSNAQWTMVLDAKTLFVRDLPHNLFAQDRCHCGTLSIYPVFERSRQITNALFDINLTQQLGPGGVPFFFHNHTVKELTQHVERQTKLSFAEWFQNLGMLTEFILYSGYVHYRYGSFDTLYSNESRLSGINNVCHNEVDIFDKKYSNMLKDSALTVSVHRNAWSRLTDPQQQAYRSLLSARGLQTTNLI